MHHTSKKKQKKCWFCSRGAHLDVTTPAGDPYFFWKLIDVSRKTPFRLSHRPLGLALIWRGGLEAPYSLSRLSLHIRRRFEAFPLVMPNRATLPRPDLSPTGSGPRQWHYKQVEVEQRSMWSKAGMSAAMKLLFLSLSLLWVREMNLRVEDASVCVCVRVCMYVCVCMGAPCNFRPYFLTFVHTFELESMHES